MEAIIDAANAEGVKIDAILAENDSTALGVVAALQAKGLDPIPLSGQDGDTANLQNVAAAGSTSTSGRTATSSARSPVRPRSSSALARRWRQLTIPDGLIDDYVAPDAGLTAADFTTPGPDGEPDSGDETSSSRSSCSRQPDHPAENLRPDPRLCGWLTQGRRCCAGVDAASRSRRAWPVELRLG